MKEKIRITKAGVPVYEGKILNVPMKKSYLKTRSIEMFDDDDPCIIHQSYIVKEFSDQIIEALKKSINHTILYTDYKSLFEVLDREDVMELQIELME